MEKIMVKLKKILNLQLLASVCLLTSLFAANTVYAMENIERKYMLASGSSDKTIKIWDISKPNGQKCIQTLAGHNYGVTSVAFSPFDHNMLASGSRDTIKIWDLSAPDGQKCVQTITGHNDWVRSVAFAPVLLDTKNQRELKEKLLETLSFEKGKNKFHDVRIKFKNDDEDEDEEDDKEKQNNINNFKF